MHAWCIHVCVDLLRRAYGVNKETKVTLLSKTAQVFFSPVQTTLEFENRSFTLKTYQTFHSDLKRQQQSVILDLWLRKTRLGNSHVHTKMQSPRFQSPTV